MFSHHRENVKKTLHKLVHTNDRKSCCLFTQQQIKKMVHGSIDTTEANLAYIISEIIKLLTTELGISY